VLADALKKLWKFEQTKQKPFAASAQIETERS
jgi:hypothetical protein